jgi:hypothetical protein
LTWRASDLIGKEVYDAAGEEIGEVGDVLLANTGEIAGFVGGAFRLGEDSVPAPFAAVEIVPTRATAMTGSIETARLNPVPATTEKAWFNYLESEADRVEADEGRAPVPAAFRTTVRTLAPNRTRRPPCAQ